MLFARFLFVVALFAFPFSLFAQTADEAAKEKLRRQTVFLEQILADAKNLRLAENRAFVYATIGNSLWQTDEKRARGLFQNSINDLIAAQNEAENEKGNKQYLNSLTYGQTPRWEILYAIANRDAEFALDALIKTRPAKISQALLNYTGDNQSQNQQFAKNEIQSEQRLIALAADQNPQRAVKLLRESLKKDISYETFSLLKKIQQKDSETALQLAEEVGQKLLGAKLGENNQDSSLIQYFMVEFGQEKTAENAALKVSDQTLRALAEKIVKFTLRPNSTSFYSDAIALKIIEKFFPGSVAQIKQRQAKFENQNQDGQYQKFSKLLQSDVSPEELLSQAEQFPGSYRNQLYQKAAEKTGQSGNIAQAQKIIRENLTGEEAERYLSQFNYNLAMQAVSQGKFDEANQIISQISDENQRLNALIQLATTVYQKNPNDNQKWAASILNEARALVADPPEKISEMNSLLNIASGYSTIEPAQAFRLVESLISPLNEFSEASAVIAKYNDYGNFRQGEYQINAAVGSLGAYNLVNVLQVLKNTDFERAVQYTNNFTRLDVRLSLQLQLIDYDLSIGDLPINGSRGNFVILTGSSRNLRRRF
jgi:hypothetical protein